MLVLVKSGGGAAVGTGLRKPVAVASPAEQNPVAERIALGQGPGAWQTASPSSTLPIQLVGRAGHRG
jgi:hypothetical protein